jgi:hypothetical protein
VTDHLGTGHCRQNTRQASSSMPSQPAPHLPPLSAAVLKAIAAGRAKGAYNLADKGLSSLPPQLIDPNLPLPSATVSSGSARDQTGGGSWWETCAAEKLDVSRNG